MLFCCRKGNIKMLYMMTKMAILFILYVSTFKLNLCTFLQQYLLRRVSNMSTVSTVAILIDYIIVFSVSKMDFNLERGST